MNLRARVQADMKRLNLRDWSSVVEFTSPDGNKYNTDNETGETLKAIQVLYDYRRLNPETGEWLTVNEPVVVMARTSLARIPEAGERWHLRVQLDPNSDDLTDFILSEVRAPEGGRSVGFIRFYPTKAKQI